MPEWTPEHRERCYALLAAGDLASVRELIAPHPDLRRPDFSPVNKKALAAFAAAMKADDGARARHLSAMLSSPDRSPLTLGIICLEKLDSFPPGPMAEALTALSTQRLSDKHLQIMHSSVCDKFKRIWRHWSRMSPVDAMAYLYSCPPWFRGNVHFSGLIADALVSDVNLMASLELLESFARAPYVLEPVPTRPPVNDYQLLLKMVIEKSFGVLDETDELAHNEVKRIMAEIESEMNKTAMAWSSGIYLDKATPAMNEAFFRDVTSKIYGKYLNLHGEKAELVLINVASEIQRKCPSLCIFWERQKYDSYAGCSGNSLSDVIVSSATMRQRLEDERNIRKAEDEAQRQKNKVLYATPASAYYPPGMSMFPPLFVKEDDANVLPFLSTPPENEFKSFINSVQMTWLENENSLRLYDSDALETARGAYVKLDIKEKTPTFTREWRDVFIQTLKQSEGFSPWMLWAEALPLAAAQDGNFDRLEQWGRKLQPLWEKEAPALAASPKLKKTGKTKWKKIIHPNGWGELRNVYTPAPMHFRILSALLAVYAMTSPKPDPKMEEIQDKFIAGMLPPQASSFASAYIHPLARCRAVKEWWLPGVQRGLAWLVRKNRDDEYGPSVSIRPGLVLLFRLAVILGRDRAKDIIHEIRCMAECEDSGMLHLLESHNGPSTPFLNHNPTHPQPSEREEGEESISSSLFMLAFGGDKDFLDVLINPPHEPWNLKLDFNKKINAYVSETRPHVMAEYLGLWKIGRSNSQQDRSSYAWQIHVIPQFLDQPYYAKVIADRLAWCLECEYPDDAQWAARLVLERPERLAPSGRGLLECLHANLWRGAAKDIAAVIGFILEGVQKGMIDPAEAYAALEETLQAEPPTVWKAAAKAMKALRKKHKRLALANPDALRDRIARDPAKLKSTLDPLLK